MSSMVNAHRAGSGGLAKLGEGARTTNDSRVSAGLSRGANLGKKLNAAPWSDTFPAPGATLDLDFANNRGFVRGVGQGGVMDAITFTRASQGAFVDQNGLLRGMVPNLLQDTQKFESSSWVPLNAFISGDAIESPNINFTANKLIENTSNAQHNLSQTVSGLSTGQTYIFGLYAKSTERFLQITFSANGVAGNPRANFDLVNGVTGTVDGALTASIVDEGNGWYRCSVSFTANLASFNVGITMVDSSTATRGQAYLGNGESGIFIWGAQLELGSTATEYFPTNISEPRFDWASTEQVAQNISTNTESTSGWNSVGTTITGNATTAPDGSSNGISFDHTSTNSRAFKTTIALIAEQTYTFSTYIKKNNGSIFVMGYAASSAPQNNPGGVVCFFNLDTNTFVSANQYFGWTYLNNSIMDVGSGWLRIAITVTAGNTTNIGNMFFAARNNTTVITGDTGLGHYFWGHQVELGDTVTNYKPNGAFAPTTTPLLANPTSNGLLIEEARGNRLFWNRDATQTQWVKTNVTAAKDQTGIDGVANAASSLTATANDGTCIQTITLAAGNRTCSVFLKRITGTGNIQVTLDGSTYSTVELSDTLWYRIVLSGSVTNPTVGIRLAVSGDAVAMDYGQVEDATAVSSPILTTSATVIRSADIPDILGENFIGFYNLNGGTVVATTNINNNDATKNRVVFSFFFNIQNLITINNSNFGTEYIVRNNNVLQGISGRYTGFVVNQDNKQCFVFTKGVLLGATNNFFTPETAANNLPNNLNKFCIASQNNISQLNGTIKQLTYFPSKQSINAVQEFSK
jgi:hypothetical protein